ncbi:MAG TPA: ferritin-like domain-containing protein [Longimicrobium sp.]|nr:ferritin-like domain-containing protein [Longimicrobium sp.]
MAATQLKELLMHELRDLLYAEQLILKMLGTLTKEVSNPEMLNRVQEHIGETEEQIQRLRRAFETIGEKPKAETCEAAVGLKAEHDSFKKDEKPSRQLMEAFDLGNGLRVEHYEIAGYRSAIAVATAIGAREAVALLSESLREEEAMASYLERNAVKALKALSAGMDLEAGVAEVQFTPDGGGSSRGGSSRKSGGSSSKSGGKSGSSASRSNGRGGSRSTADTSSGGRSGGSRSSSGGSKSTASKSSGSSSSGGSKSSGGGSKSGSGGSSGGGSRSASRSGGSSSRTTAERSSGGSRSKSGGSSKSGSSSKSSSSSKSGGSSGSGSKSRSSRSRSGSSSS